MLVASKLEVDIGRHNDPFGETALHVKGEVTQQGRTLTRNLHSYPASTVPLLNEYVNLIRRLVLLPSCRSDGKKKGIFSLKVFITNPLIVINTD